VVNKKFYMKILFLKCLVSLIVLLAVSVYLLVNFFFAITCFKVLFSI